MLREIKDQLERDEIRELIGMSIFPDPEKLDRVIAAYRSNPLLQIAGYMDRDDEDQVIGIVGFTLDASKELAIQHLAVLPEMRGLGYGRGMLLELIHQYEPQRVSAETDEEAVDFYRSVGFTVESLGEKYPGVERFLCVYETDSSESE